MAEALDLQILEEIARRTPEGKEGDLIVGLLLYGFDLDIPVYKKTLLEGLQKRGTKIPEWLEKKLVE
jgi:hypothetical protein